MINIISYKILQKLKVVFSVPQKHYNTKNETASTKNLKIVICKNIL